MIDSGESKTIHRAGREKLGNRVVPLKAKGGCLSSEAVVVQGA